MPDTTTHPGAAARTTLGVALLALVLRLGLLGWAWSHRVSLLPPGVWDEQGYHLLAVNLLRHHRLAVGAISTDPELRRAAGWCATQPPAYQRSFASFNSRDRTPGFPAFLAAVYAVTGPSPYAAAAAMCIVSALAAGLVYQATARAIGPTTGVAAGLLMAISPEGILNSTQILSDTLHMVLLAAFLLAVVGAIKRASAVAGAVAGLCLGAAILVRPITVYAPFVLAVVLLLARVRPAVWASMLVAAYCIVAPWCVRNAIVYGRFGVSGIAKYNLLAYNLAFAKARATGRTVEAVQAEYAAEAVRTPDGGSALARRELARYWPLVVRNQLVGAAMFWVSVDRSWWSQVLTGRMVQADALNRAWRNGLLDAARSIARSPGGALAMATAGLNGLWTLLALAGAAVCIKRKIAPTEVAVAVTCCAYYSLLSGAVSIARFRLAAEPFAAMLAGVGIAWLVAMAARRSPQAAGASHPSPTA